MPLFVITTGAETYKVTFFTTCRKLLNKIRNVRWVGYEPSILKLKMYTRF
jgi:hypothetical protein